jgi:hypothetical protein
MKKRPYRGADRGADQPAHLENDRAENDPAEMDITKERTTTYAKQSQNANQLQIRLCRR